MCPHQGPNSQHFGVRDVGRSNQPSPPARASVLFSMSVPRILGSSHDELLVVPNRLRRSVYSAFPFVCAAGPTEENTSAHLFASAQGTKHDLPELAPSGMSDLTHPPGTTNLCLLCIPSTPCKEFFFFVRFFILIFFRERGREGERVREEYSLVASCTSPNGDLAHNPGMCPDRESNWRPFVSQASAQSTEPHQTGL